MLCVVRTWNSFVSFVEGLVACILLMSVLVALVLVVAWMLTPLLAVWHSFCAFERSRRAKARAYHAETMKRQARKKKQLEQQVRDELEPKIAAEVSNRLQAAEKKRQNRTFLFFLAWAFFNMIFVQCVNEYIMGGFKVQTWQTAICFLIPFYKIVVEPVQESWGLSDPKCHWWGR